MKNLSVGDVVVVGYFGHAENKSVGEPRWVIITEDLQDEFEAVPMTKQVHQKSHYPKSFIVESNSPDGIKMGLEYSSLIIPGRKAIIKKIAFNKCYVKGKCSEEFLDKLIALL
jgi:hypothetical protein